MNRESIKIDDNLLFNCLLTNLSLRYNFVAVYSYNARCSRDILFPRAHS